MLVKVEDLEGLPRWGPFEAEVKKSPSSVQTESQQCGSVAVTRPLGKTPKRFRIILEVGSRGRSRELASLEKQIASLNVDRAKRYITRSASRHPYDVCFTFPATNTEIWETSAFLKKQSSYFADLLTSEFAEGTPTASSKKRKVTAEGSTTVGKPKLDSAFDDSDDETDRALALDKRDEPTCELPIHEITITSSFTTYRAVLCYLRTGYITFSKLSSSSPEPPPSSRAPSPPIAALPPAPFHFGVGTPPVGLSSQPPPTPSSELPPFPRPASPSPFSSSAAPAALAPTPTPTASDPLLAPPPSVSPKSVYRLAHLLDHTVLQSLALKELASQLTTSNVATELFGDVARACPEVWKMEMEHCVKHWATVKDSQAMKEIEALVEREELPGGGRVLMELAKRLRT